METVASVLGKGKGLGEEELQDVSGCSQLLPPLPGRAGFPEPAVSGDGQSAPPLLPLLHLLPALQGRLPLQAVHLQ